MKRRGILTIMGSMLAACGVLAPAPVAASADGGAWSQGRGFSLGVQFAGNFIGADDPGPASSPNALFVDENGRGVGLNLGYAFTPAFSLRLVVTGAQHETNQTSVEVMHSAATIEAHYRFMQAERARPYVFGGLGGTTLRADQEGFSAEATGGTAAFGAGLLYNLTPHLLFDFTARLDGINFDKVEVTQKLPDGSTVQISDSIEESGSAAKLMLGLLWQF